MNVAEKFEITINLIEKLTENPELKAHEIGSLVAKDCGMQFRDMSTVFSYLLGRTLNSYIIERKLMHAYRLLIESRKHDISKAIEISGYADQPSFLKAFKKQFGTTPKQAFDSKDPSLLTEPVTWDQLSDSISSHDLPIYEHAEDEKKMIFGVTEEAYKNISKAMELEAFYGLPKMFSSYAFELFEKKGYPMEACFRYAVSLREFGGDFDGENEITDGELLKQTPEARMRTYGDNEVIQKVFFRRGISVDYIIELIDKHGAELDDLMKCDQEMLEMYPGFDMSMSFKYYLKAYEFYTQYYAIEENEEAFYDYISDVMRGVPIEYAFLDAAHRVEIDNGIEDLCDYGEEYIDPLAADRRRRIEELEERLDRWM